MGLKILLFSHKFFPDIGGIETNSLLLAHAFTAAGHIVHVLTWSLDPLKKDFPFTVVRVPGKHQLFNEHRWADVVFENNPCLRMSWPNLIFKKPSVIALNTWITRNDGSLGIQDKIKLNILKRANKVIAVSEAIRKGCWPASVVIRNFYGASEFYMIPEVPRNKAFVFLGRLVSAKGANHAILALKALLEINNGQESEMELSLTIIGEGPEKISLEQMVKDLNLQNQVRFTGTLQGKELTLCLNRHRYILVPSIWEEPFGNVVLEGMACGCLPVVSNGGGLPEAVGKAGLTFKRGDIESLVNQIKRLLEKPEWEKKLREAAPQHLAAHLPEVVCKKYLEIIKAAALTK